MYTTMLAFASALEAPSLKNSRRTYITVLVFATGAVVGWPFALALAIPFTIEELFIQGVDRVAPHTRLSWMAHRWKRLILAGASASLLFVSSTRASERFPLTYPI
jgi:alpha-1,2-mannosyltransferase